MSTTGTRYHAPGDPACDRRSALHDHCTGHAVSASDVAVLVDGRWMPLHAEPAHDLDDHLTELDRPGAAAGQT